MGKGAFAVLTFTILLSTWSLGQVASCTRWDSLSKNFDNTTKAKAFRLLEFQPVQKDCFFENYLALFKQNSASTLDSVRKICTIWQTVSNTPCKAEVAFVQFMSSHFSQVFQERFCKESHRVYTECGSSSFPFTSSLFSTLCLEFSCPELDSLLKKHLTTIDLEEAKKINNLLAQRNCTTNATFIETNRHIQTKEPNFQALYQMGLHYHKEEKWNDAYYYYSLAEKRTQLPQQQAICYLGIAKTLAEQKNWSKSKDFVLLATQTDPQSQESFVFLAQLLLNAEQTCSFNKEEKTALYVWLARSYQKAGNKNEADTYLKKSNIKAFVEDKNAPSKIKLGCFLNEEIQLR